MRFFNSKDSVRLTIRHIRLQNKIAWYNEKIDGRNKIIQEYQNKIINNENFLIEKQTDNHVQRQEEGIEDKVTNIARDFRLKLSKTVPERNISFQRELMCQHIIGRAQQRVLLAALERERFFRARDFQATENSPILKQDVLLEALKQRVEVVDTLPLEPEKTDTSLLPKLQAALELAKEELVIMPIEIAPEDKYGPHLSVVALMPLNKEVRAIYFDPFYQTEAPKYLRSVINEEDLIEIEFLPAPTLGYFSGHCVFEFAMYIQQNPLSANKRLKTYTDDLLKYLDSLNILMLSEQCRQAVVKPMQQAGNVAPELGYGLQE